MNARFLRRQLLAGLTLFCLPALALAASYRVDLIVFLDQHYQQGSPGEHPQPAVIPETAGAVDFEDPDSSRGSALQALDAEGSALAEVWNRLRNSQRFKPLLHASWAQHDPPASGGPAVRLHEGQRYTIGDALQPDGLRQVQALDGTARLNLSRYLHLSVDLQYAQHQAEGIMGYPLRDSRRMRSGELHHIDGPRFGVLAKITPLEAAE